MDWFKNLFRNKASTPPLPPFQDSVLGVLKWDEDCEGWVAPLPSGPNSATLYIGAGSANEYPGEPLLALMREPFNSYDEHCKRALAHLQQNAKSNPWNVDPGTLTPAGMQTYEHDLEDRTYTVIFTAPDESIWKVNFHAGAPTSWGVDD
jgi:hypothetical protein